MADLFPVLWWSGPMGIGVFLMGLGVLFWGISRVEAVRRPSLRREGEGRAAPSTK